jgi:hypothetical protein
MNQKITAGKSMPTDAFKATQYGFVIRSAHYDLKFNVLQALAFFCYGKMEVKCTSVHVSPGKVGFHVLILRTFK